MDCACVDVEGGPTQPARCHLACLGRCEDAADAVLRPERRPEDDDHQQESHKELHCEVFTLSQELSSRIQRVQVEPPAAAGADGNDAESSCSGERRSKAQNLFSEVQAVAEPAATVESVATVTAPPPSFLAPAGSAADGTHEESMPLGLASCSRESPCSRAVPPPMLPFASPAPAQLLQVAPKPAQDKLTSILSFLDEVEESSRADICSLTSSARSSPMGRRPSPLSPRDLGAVEASILAGPAGRATTPRLAEGAFALQSRVALLEVEVKDKRKTVQTLKKALSAAKDHEERVRYELTKEWEEKLRSEKSQYEAGSERQLKLADRLLADKTELTKRCEVFSEELKAMERKCQMKVEELDQKASKDLSRQKQHWTAAERVRREAWEKEKVREIKEMTIKGLQPEVERILAERKQERQKLDERHQQMLESQRRELTELAQTQVREAREQVLQEQEDLLKQEREVHRRKQREEFDRFDGLLQEERTKFAADLLAERRKLEQVMQQAADDFEGRLRDSIAAERIKAEASLEGVRTGASDAEERHRAELQRLQERYRAEKEQWQQEHLDRTQEELERRETTLREEITLERDRQLEVIMYRLNHEHAEQQRAARDESSALLEGMRAEASEASRRLSAQLEEALAEVTTVEAKRAQFEKMAQCLQARLEELESQHGVRVRDLESQVRDLEAGQVALRQAADEALKQHQDELWRIGEMKDKELMEAHEAQRQLSVRLAESRLLADEQELEAQRREERMIGDLEARVKRTLQAKDGAVQELRTRCAASEKKVKDFEYLLARQREELLSGITKDVLSQ